MMSYVFHPEALAEYAEAAQYYSAQNTSIAQDFVNAIEAAIDKIRENPERYSLIDDDIRRCLTYKFPYAILYEIQADYILIWAVMHCKRDPKYWESRS